MDSQLSWNIGTDVTRLFAFPFMVHAFLAGTVVAIVAGLVGWYMVLRRQSFAGHTLAVVGFPGAAGATLLGLPLSAGLFAFCLGGALLIGAAGSRGAGLPRTQARQAAAIGIVQAFALACGFLFVSLYRGNISGVSALLFGSFLGVTARQVATLACGGVVALLLLGCVARPLLFASVDPAVAEAAALPVARLGVLFLLLLGAAAAEASQITGALLVFALLVMPAATAQKLSARPALSALLAALLALGVTWLGLAVAYYSPYPIGFCITSLAFAAYLLAHAPRLGPLHRVRHSGWADGAAG